MSDEAENATNLNQVIEEQSKTIKTLVEKFKTGLSGGTGQNPIYWTTPSSTEKAAPNYVLYIGIGVGLWWFLKGRK